MESESHGMYVLNLKKSKLIFEFQGTSEIVIYFLQGTSINKGYPIFLQFLEIPTYVLCTIYYLHMYSVLISIRYPPTQKSDILYGPFPRVSTQPIAEHIKDFSLNLFVSCLDRATCTEHLISAQDLLKVSKSQNKFMKSSFLPKYEQNILRISALASKKWLNQKLYHTNYVK